MTISTLPTAPSRATDTAAEFSTKADALLAALATFVTEANATAAAMNLNSTNDTSSSSVAIGTGAKTFTVSSGKSFQPGMYLVIADTAAPSTNSMIAQVTSYSGTSLVVNVISVSGSGTKTAWTISQSMLTASVVGDHEVTVSVGNGHGATNTKIRRFTTTTRSAGTAITYADSATLGATFTINESGLYEVYYSDARSTAANTAFGVTLNSASLTSNITTITSATERLLFGFTVGGAVGGPAGAVTRTLRLVATDVLRAHTDGSADGTTAVVFSVRKVGL